MYAGPPCRSLIVSARTRVAAAAPTKGRRRICPRAQRGHTLVIQRRIGRIFPRHAFQLLRSVLITSSGLRIWPQLVGSARVRKCVETDRVKVIHRSTQAALHHPKKFGSCKVPARGIRIEAAKRQSRFIVAAAETGIEWPLYQPCPKTTIFQPSAAYPRLIGGFVSGVEDQAGLRRFPARPCRNH